MKRKDVKFCFTEKETELQQQNAEIRREKKLNIIIGKAEAIEKSNNSVMQDISEWRQRRDIYILSC